MKIQEIIKKNKILWFLLGVSFLFFILRLPSLIEPNWYGDEGIYQTIGIALSKGRLLYVQIWDNKPPLLYLLYALFHGDQFQVRLFSLITGLLSTIAFFALSKLLFKNLKAGIISTIIFSILFATPLLEGNIANAENFMVLPAILVGYLIYALSSKHPKRESLIFDSRFLILFAAGLLLGISFLFKIVAVFDFAAFFVFLKIINLPDDFLSLFYFGKTADKSKAVIKSTWSFLISNALVLIAGFLLPFIVTILYFIINHALSDFTQAAFFSNVGYVGYGNKLIIPQGFLILKLGLLAAVVLFVFWKRKNLSKTVMFTMLWFAFSLFNAYFSGRPYAHYTLVVLSSFCLMIGLFFDEVVQKTKLILFLIIIVSAVLLNSTFKFNFKKSVSYYGNTVSFLTGRESVESYQAFFDQKTPRDYKIASFIKFHTGPIDNIFVWGDSAQIYALSGKIPPGKYTVAYHIDQYKNAIAQTQIALNQKKPKYIVTLDESPPIPFDLPAYENRLNLTGAVIYERSL